MSVTIRPMTAADIPVGMRLKQLAGWNQTEADWHRFLALQPDGLFIAEIDGQGVGTVAGFVFENVAWIAMVLVGPTYRKQGIGTALMNHALAFLGKRTIRLDATAQGQPVYEKLGFVGEYELGRYEGVLVGAASPPRWVRPGRGGDAALTSLDEGATGTRRAKLLTALGAARVAGTTGYLMDRPGSRATQLGPAIALDEATGRALFDDAAYRLRGQPVFIDIPLDNRPAVAWAGAAGLTLQRKFLRMRRGPAIVDQPQLIWASSGPEKG
ncbi:MAG: hypothetical protein PCFJNLEI_04107 [Verrucomicrobiae bacterium]|nr:hypothetical protein [Verrucomicrobiae bacterium]